MVKAASKRAKIEQKIAEETPRKLTAEEIDAAIAEPSAPPRDYGTRPVRPQWSADEIEAELERLDAVRIRE